MLTLSSGESRSSASKMARKCLCTVWPADTGKKSYRSVSSYSFNPFADFLSIIETVNSGRSERLQRGPVVKPSVFRNFIEDTPELIQMCLKSDSQKLAVFTEYQIENRDRLLIDVVIKENYPMIKDIYHHVQSRSTTYPNPSLEDFTKHFFQFTDLEANNLLSPSVEIRRCHFIDYFVRLAKSQPDEEQHDSIKLRKIMAGLVPFYATIQKRQLERERVIWLPAVDKVLRMNEDYIRELFSSMGAPKPINSDLAGVTRRDTSVEHVTIE